MATKPTKAPPPTAASFVKITVNLPPEVAEMARTAAFWTPGSTVASIVAAGIALEVKRLEKKRGEPFPPRRGPVKAGPPFRS